MKLNNFRYYFFSIDILKEQSWVINWGLDEGKITSIIDTGSSSSVKKISDKMSEYLSEIYIFNLFNYKALCTFCEIAPDFILNLRSKNKTSELKREDLSHFNWDYYKDMGSNIPLDPLELVSIFSNYKTIDKKHLYYKKNPLLLYIEPKSEVALTVKELDENITYLREELDLFGNLQTNFNDCVTTSLLNYGNYTDNTIVFLSNKNLNSKSEIFHFRIHDHFIRIMEYIISNHYLDYYRGIFLKYVDEIDGMLERSQNFSSKLSSRQMKTFKDFLFSLLILRNNFNKSKFQYKTVSFEIETVNNSIKYSTGLRLTDSLAAIPDCQYNFATTLLKKVDNSVFNNKSIIESINEKINFQENFSLSFFESINAIKNIELQKKVYYLTIFVAILTILFFLFSQWNDETILRKFLEKFKFLVI